MFSILIPTYNNIEYLKFCIDSIKKNSKFNHQIICHVNIGDDGTNNFLKDSKIEFSHTLYNSGICEGINKAAKLAKYDHQIIIHINEGIDGSLEYVKDNNLTYTYSKQNIGMPKALNKASKLSKNLTLRVKKKCCRPSPHACTHTPNGTARVTPRLAPRCARAPPACPGLPCAQRSARAAGV